MKSSINPKTDNKANTADFRIAVVRAISDNDACVRLQSDAIVRGLATVPGFECTVYKPNTQGFAGSQLDCIGFHYNDIEAVQFLRNHHHLAPNALIACFGADIYSYDAYTELVPWVDFFIVPTELHRSVLAAQFQTPIFVMPEPVDPMAIAPSFNWEFPLKRTRRLGWFGYPESFYKGMLSLMPVIQRHLEVGTLDDFTLLTDPKRFPNDWDLKVRHFSKPTFITDLRTFDYVILSHFPLDLQVNSLIKSPNKAVTALVAGTIPIATDTPSYRKLFSTLGLERFLIGSPRELDNLLMRLDPIADSNFIRECGALSAIKDRLSDANTASIFVDILVECALMIRTRNGIVGVAPPISFARFSLERVKFINRLARTIRTHLPQSITKRASE